MKRLNIDNSNENYNWKNKSKNIGKRKESQKIAEQYKQIDNSMEKKWRKVNNCILEKL